MLRPSSKEGGANPKAHTQNKKILNSNIEIRNNIKILML